MMQNQYNFEWKLSPYEIRLEMTAFLNNCLGRLWYQIKFPDFPKVSAISCQWQDVKIFFLFIKPQQKYYFIDVEHDRRIKIVIQREKQPSSSVKIYSIIKCYCISYSARKILVTNNSTITQLNMYQKNDIQIIGLKMNCACTVGLLHVNYVDSFTAYFKICIYSKSFNQLSLTYLSISQNCDIYCKIYTVYVLAFLL